jgi:hypothetical protein
MFTETAHAQPMSIAQWYHHFVCLIFIITFLSSFYYLSGSLFIYILNCKIVFAWYPHGGRGGTVLAGTPKLHNSF